MERYHLALQLPEQSNGSAHSDRWYKILPKAVADVLLSEKKAKLFDHIEQQKALELKRTLEKTGLRVDIEVSLDRACLEKGLIFLKKRIKYKIEYSLMNHRLFSLPGLYKNKKSNGTKIDAVIQKSLVLLPLGRLALSLLITFPFFMYFLRYVSQTGTSHSLATATSIIFLMISILFLPQLIRNKTVRVLLDKAQNPSDTLVDVSSVDLRKNIYLVYDSKKHCYAKIEVRKNNITCYLLGTNHSINWSRNNTGLGMRDSITEISETVLEETSLFYVFKGYETVKKLYHKFLPSKKSSRSSQLLTSESDMLLFNETGEEISTITQGSHYTIDFDERYLDYYPCFKAILIASKERPLL